METTKGDTFQTDTYFPANPPGVDTNDHTALLYLSDATLLHNTRQRYMRDDIYTFVGPILVSVNPFKCAAAARLRLCCSPFAAGLGSLSALHTTCVEKPLSYASLAA